MKKIKDTKIGKFLSEKAPQILAVVGDVLPEQGTLGIVKNLISKDPDLTSEDKEQLHQQLVEFYKLEVEDRDSARKREVEILKVGGIDWMMNITGVIGLVSFVFLIIAIVFINIPEHNKELMIHSCGLVEGVAVSIVSFYFGGRAKKS